MTVTTKKTCTVKGCKRPYQAKGYCVTHYKKWRRGEMDKKPRYKLCHEEGCKKQMFKRGICKDHFEAWVASRSEAAAAAAAPAPTPAPAAPAKAAEPKKEETKATA